MRLRRLAALALSFALVACAGPGSIPCSTPVAGGGAVVAVIDHGWHTDLAIPADELTGRLAVFRRIYPGARVVLFGFGKRTFLTARVDSWREYLLGPFPGPGAMTVAALSRMPQDVYPPDEVATLHLPPSGADALSEFVWRSFRTDATGAPTLIGPGRFHGSLFYAATDTYTLAHTCNGWTADALRAAGVAIDPDGIVLSGQVMHRIRAAELCPLNAAPTALAVAH